MEGGKEGNWKVLCTCTNNLQWMYSLCTPNALIKVKIYQRAVP